MAGVLDSAPLGRAATVVGDGRDVGDGGDLEAGGLERADRLLPSGTGALHEHLDMAHAVLHGALGGSVRAERGGIRRALAGALETREARAAPGDGGARQIGDGHDGVVERCLDMGMARRHVLPFPSPRLRCALAFRHVGVVLLSVTTRRSARSVCYFLRRTPTVFLGPRRWRALVLVRCPRTGRFRRWRSPRYEPISWRRLMLSATSRRRSPSTL